MSNEEHWIKAFVAVLLVTDLRAAIGRQIALKA
jgi:hypothetical protein